MNNTTPPRIHDYLAKPREIPLRVLVRLTRDYHAWSARSVDYPRSNFHAWYYRLSAECVRRGLDLDRIVRQ